MLDNILILVVFLLIILAIFYKSRDKRIPSSTDVVVDLSTSTGFVEIHRRLINENNKFTSVGTTALHYSGEKK